VRYVLPASILALAILIYALMPRYYLVVVSKASGDSADALSQIGPFATPGMERIEDVCPEWTCVKNYLRNLLLGRG
jgi:hypothetical protein